MSRTPMPAPAQQQGSHRLGRGRTYHVRLQVVVVAVAVAPLPALKHLLFMLPVHLRVHGDGRIGELIWGVQSRVRSQVVFHSLLSTPAPTIVQKQIKVCVSGFGGGQVQQKKAPTDQTRLPLHSLKVARN